MTDDCDPSTCRLAYAPGWDALVCHEHGVAYLRGFALP